MIADGDKRSSERQARFRELWAEVSDGLALLEVTSPELVLRGHRAWAWDARSLPTRSHYVPVFLKILERLEAEGALDPTRDVLVETTTGNAGAAIAYVAGRLGYPVVVFMPEDMPEARLRDVTSYLPTGSELRLTPAREYVKGMVRALRDFLVSHRSGYRGRQLVALDHSRRSEAVGAIAECVGTLLKGSALTFDFAVVALGNGTSASGVAQAARLLDPAVRVVGVEPFEAPCAFVAKYGTARFREQYTSEPAYGAHRLLGTGGWGVRFPNLNLNLIDDVWLVAEDAWAGQLERLRRRGVGVGHSTSACLHVVEALSVLHRQAPLNFLTVIYDPLDKYEEGGEPR